MSHFSPAAISHTLAEFDALVRQGLQDGDVVEKVNEKETQIKMFYKTCMRLTDPAQMAAFNTSYFLHGFMRDFRKAKDSATFLEDQQRCVRKYDVKCGAAAAPIPPVAISGPLGAPMSVASLAGPIPVSAAPNPTLGLGALPISLAAVSGPRAPVAVASHAPVAMASHAPIAAASLAPAPSPMSVPATTRKSGPARKAKSPPPISLAAVSATRAPVPAATASVAPPPSPISVPSTTRKSGAARKPKSPPHAIAGPGPNTMFMAAAARTGMIRHPLPETDCEGPRSTMDEEEGFIHTLREIEESTMESDVIEVKPPPSKRAKGKEKEKQRGSDNESWCESIIVSRPRPTVSTHSQQKPRGRAGPIPTGELHLSPCSRCRIGGKDCEKQEAGGACVNCRTFKHKCEYAKRARNQKKSKPMVESEDDLSATMRGPREAAKATRQAIQEVVGESPTATKPRALIRLKSQRPRTPKATVQDQLADILDRVDALTTFIVPMANLVNRLYDAVMEEQEREAEGETEPTQPPPSLAHEPPPSSPLAAAAPLVNPPSSPTPVHVPPNVNLIHPTPQHSQEVQPPLTQLHPTPPQPVDAPPHAAADIPQQVVAAAVLPMAAVMDLVPVAPTEEAAMPEEPSDAPILPQDSAPTCAASPVSSPATANIPAASASPISPPATSIVPAASSPLPDSPSQPQSSGGTLLSQPDHLQQSFLPVLCQASSSSSTTSAMPETAVSAAAASDISTSHVPPATASSLSPDSARMSPGPAGHTRARSKTPMPAGPMTLAVPVVSPLRTRSGTRSRSPMPLPGIKRKANDDQDEAGGAKKHKI
ncbi:hypothetical protein BYT27DRAFT_7248037 [Phlegmacium glaucopus]|nr:hypothetical protein BYT27DRAFT_7248037 [Phlegmacium glaucopus]